MKNNKKISLFMAVPLVFIILCALATFIAVIFISRYNYYAGTSLKEAEYVGLENYKSFMADNSFWMIIRNSVLIGTGSAVFGGVYIFVSLMGMSGIKNKWLRAAALCVPVILVCVPTVMYSSLWYHPPFNNPELSWHMYQFPRAWTIIFEAFSWASMWVIAGSFSGKRKDIRHCLGTALIFVCLRLIFLLYSDPAFGSMASNDLTRQFGETISSFIYDRGRVFGDYGYASAMSIIRLILSVLFTIIFACIYPCASKRFSVMLMMNDKEQSRRALWITPIVLAGIFIIIVCVMNIYDIQRNIDFYGNTITTESRVLSAVWLVKAFVVPFIIAVVLSAVTWLITYAVSIRNMLVTICCILILPFIANSFAVFVGRITPNRLVTLMLIYLLQSVAWVFVFLAATGFSKETPRVFFKQMTPMIIMGFGLFYARQISDYTALLYSGTASVQTTLRNFMGLCRYPLWQIVFILVLPVILCLGGLFVATAFVKD